MPRNQLLSKIDMDFNSNDEYLKAFPPNFGPKLEGLNMSKQLPASDFQVQKAQPENQQDNIEDNIEDTCMKQMPEPACLYEELECVEVEEPIQVHTPVHNADNKGDEMLKVHELLTLCKEDLAPARDKSSLAQPIEVLEPMPQVVDTTPVMEVQRDNEMVLGVSGGEPREPRGLETALPLQANETRVFDAGETLSDTQVEGIEITQETTIHCEIPAVDDVITIGVLKDSLLALDNIGHHDDAEKSVLEEALEVAATMKDETLFGSPTLREFVEGTHIVVDQERAITDIDAVEGNAMDTETLQDVQNGQPASTLGEIEFVEDTVTTTLIETSENADAIIGQIETTEEEPDVTVEMVKTTTIRTTYETQTSPNELSTEHTQILECEALQGAEDATTMAVEITEKTTIKAKAVRLCEAGEEEPDPIARNGVHPSTSASNYSTTGFEDLGTCSEADVDKIVDSIMNDIADIEADMEVENEEEFEKEEADGESNAQHLKLEICGKAIGMGSTAGCQEYGIPSVGRSHV